MKTSNKMITAGTALSAIGSYNTIKEFYNSTKDIYNTKYRYEISIDQNDDLYEDVLQWVANLAAESSQRKISLVSRKVGENSKYQIKKLFDNFNNTTVMIDGYKVTVVLDSGQSQGKPSGGYDSPDFNSLPMIPLNKTIKFYTLNKNAHKAVVDNLTKIADQKSINDPVVRIATRWGSWQKRTDVPKREYSSIILPKEQRDRIRNDLDTFISSEESYVKLGIPWHRGYLFHGPPGTGKTSLAKGLASEFNLNLFYLPLSDKNGEADILELLGGVEPRSILLLEDIDTIAASHSREDTTKSGDGESKMSLGTLLNTLDGVATPHGLITIMTTNYIDRLDSALTRAGRMDMVEHIGLPGPGEIKNMFEFYYNVKWPDEVDAGLIAREAVSQSTIAECFKTNLHDPDGALVELFKAVRNSNVFN